MNPNQKAPLQASKWLDLRILIDAEEMETLCRELPAFQIYATGAIFKKGQGRIDLSQFLEGYRHYIESLKEGKLPDEQSYRQLFSSLWAREADQLAITAVNETEYLIRPSLPVVQLSHHRFSYSSMDGKFRSMVLGPKSITWGIQFAYPQIFQDPETKDIKPVTDESEFPNTPLFRALQLWVRHHTLPSPFIVDGKPVNVPIRIGKSCLKWINKHPQLLAQNLQIR